MAKDQVHSVMSNNVITINNRATMHQAADVMAQYKIRHLPVTDGNGRIIGLLSDRDLRAITSKSNDEVSKVLRANVASQSVIYFMSFPVTTVAEGNTVASVARKLLKSKISSLLVVDEKNEPCGIVTTDDLLRYLIFIIEDKDSEVEATVGSVFRFLRMAEATA